MSIDEVLLSKKIEEQIYIAKEKPTTIELLSILGSYGDTLDDEEILDLLIAYNETGTVMEEVFCSVYDTPDVADENSVIVKGEFP